MLYTRIFHIVHQTCQVLAEQQACQSRNVISVIGPEVVIHQRTIVDTVTEM